MNKYEGFVGKVLDGRYKILELVGMGGMACVLKAQDLVMNRIVAIKILNDEYNGNEQAEARFIDESKAVAMLSNKNIVSVYDVAIYPDIKYIVMEYLDGITLREYLDNKGAISWKEACIYILQILRALEHAHSKGIIHRDIKPQNVILMKNGDIKVTDFGIAKLPNSVSERIDEKAVGTVYYISPEQACGKETDYYSDIYSVGIMFYEAVTGTLPFTAETPMEIAMMQVNDDPVHPRDIVLDIPVGVSQIILKAMEKSPSERFQSAHTMVKAIEWVLRYPDVIFAMNPAAAEETAGKSSVVSIDMIATSEIEPYDEEEIADTLGTKKTPVKKAQSGDGKGAKANGKKKKKRKTSRSMFPIIAGVAIAFFVVALMLGIFILRDVFTSFTAEGDDIEAEYPDITGTLFSEELKNDLRNGKYGAKFVIDEVIYESRDDMENNLIISTEPQAGHLSKPGDDGKLHFNTVTVNRSQKVFLPVLEGYPRTTVETMLKKLELKYEFVETSESENPYYQNGQVIGSEPVANTELKVGDTVTVYIYAKPESLNTAKMPDLTGMTEAEAKKFAETYAHYTVQFQYVETLGGNNRVSGQSIPVGTVSPKGTVVTVYIATPPQNVPRLYGMTPDEARTLLSQTFPDRQLNINIIYVLAEESDKFYVELARTEYHDDMFMFIDSLLGLGCTYSNIYDGHSTVVFQSIPANDPLPQDVYGIDLIVVQYTNAEAPESSAGESGNPFDVDTEVTP